MKLVFSAQAQADIGYWNKHEPAKTAKIVRLLENVLLTPCSGLGKPEPLKHALQGYWSRRIDHEHRLVYRVDGDTIIVVSCRYHYSV